MIWTILLMTTLGSEVCSICLGEESYQHSNHVTIQRGKELNLLHAHLCCGHKFHLKCILRWAENHLSCPPCRKSLKVKTKRKLRLQLPESIFSLLPKHTPYVLSDVVHALNFLLFDQSYARYMQVHKFLSEMFLLAVFYPHSDLSEQFSSIH